MDYMSVAILMRINYIILATNNYSNVKIMASINFFQELDKMYAEGAPEDDMRERVEEMERMRESVFKEVDTNKDGFIDYQEFLQQTKRNEYEKDNGWQGLDEQKPFTDEELDEYIRQHQVGVILSNNIQS